LIREIFGNRKLGADDKPPLPIGTPVSSRPSDQFAPTRQHQPTHAPPFIKSRQTVQSLKEIPSLDDWEKEWGKYSQRSVQPKLLLVFGRAGHQYAGHRASK
jgi:hypothetical protein